MKYKFRGRRYLRSGEWVYGSVVELSDSTSIVNEVGSYAVEPQTVSLYWGEDSDGTELFEGDYVYDLHQGVVRNMGLIRRKYIQWFNSENPTVDFFKWDMDHNIHTTYKVLEKNNPTENDEVYTLLHMTGYLPDIAKELRYAAEKFPHTTYIIIESNLGWYWGKFYGGEVPNVHVALEPTTSKKEYAEK
jgi:hypothetical protein